MKEDLAIARNSLMALQAENLALRRTAQYSAGSSQGNNNANVHDHVDPEMAEALGLEKRKRHDIERELEIQVIRLSCNFSGHVITNQYAMYSIKI